MTDDAHVKWYVIGVLVTVITPTIMNIWNSCCGSVWHGLHSWLFQIVAKKFEVCENRFQGVGNTAAITRVVKALGLHTYRFRWQHDANADTNDSYQVGTVRLPTRSWCLWLLALLGITHYIWVKDDGSSIVMTGPEISVKALLKVSNLAANRQPTEAELEELKTCIGFGATDVATERCVVCERLAFVIFILASLLVLRNYQILPSRLFHIVCACLGAYGFVLIVNCLWKSCTGDWWLGLCRRRVSAFYYHGAARTINSAQNLEVPLHTAEVADVQSEEIVESTQRRYSVVIGRDAWYEVHCQYPMELHLTANLPTIPVESYPVLVAMRQNPKLSKLVAHSLSVGDDLVYVCVHNPMTDLHVIEMKELVSKADRGIVLVVILPALEEFDEALLHPMTNRLHANKEARYVATYADFSTWLSVISMGLFPKVLLILPYHDMNVVTSSRLWRIASDTIKSILM